MEAQKEIQKQFRQQQEKLVYYLIALSVTSIGFSVYKTTGQPLKWIQIPLALSISSWALSIFCGFRFLKYVISTLYANNEYLNINGEDRKLIIKANAILEAMRINSSRASFYMKWQERLFYSGIVLFLIWHIFEMYQITKS